MPTDLQDWVQTLLGLLVLSVGYLARSQLVRIAVVRTFVTYIRARAAAPRELSEMRKLLTMAVTRLTSIEAELKPNGGSSLSDRIVRLEVKQRTRDSLMRSSLIEFGANGDLLYVSEEAQQVFQVTSVEDLLKRSWMSRIEPSDRNGVQTEFQQAIGDRREIYLKFKLRDSVAQLQMVAKPLIDIQTRACYGWQGQMTKA